MIQGLGELWKENQDAVLSLLRSATVNIETLPQLAELIKGTIDELEKLKRLDPKTLRIAMSGTPGEVVVDATNKKIWNRIRMKLATLTQAPEESKRTGPFSRLKQKFGRSGGPKTTELTSAPTISASAAPSEVSIASEANTSTSSDSAPPDMNFAGLEVAMLWDNMAEEFRAIVLELQGSVPTIQEMVQIAGGDPSSHGSSNDIRLTPELRECVFATSLDPLVSRVTAIVQPLMAESLNEMGDLVKKAALSALEECQKVVESQMKAQESEDTRQVRAETLERLTCWGNAVAAQGVIQEMKRMREAEDLARLLRRSHRQSSSGSDRLSRA